MPGATAAPLSLPYSIAADPLGSVDDSMKAFADRVHALIGAVDDHETVSVPLAGDRTGTVDAFVRGRVAVVAIGVTCPTGIAAFGSLATLPADLRVSANGLVWNNNTGAAVGVYVDSADGSIRTRSAIGAGHLLLGQFILPLALTYPA